MQIDCFPLFLAIERGNGFGSRAGCMDDRTASPARGPIRKPGFLLVAPVVRRHPNVGSGVTCKLPVFGLIKQGRRDADF